MSPAPDLTPEFSRVVARSGLGPAVRRERLVADADERAALAARFGLLGLDRLEADLELRATAIGIACRGRVRAAVVQACVVSGLPVPAHIDAPLDLVFAEEPEPPGGEIELEADALDRLPLENGRADVGEAAAQTLALALEPYPRAPDAALAEARRRLVQEEEAEALIAAGRNSPFSRLKAP